MNVKGAGVWASCGVCSGRGNVRGGVLRWTVGERRVRVGSGVSVWSGLCQVGLARARDLCRDL